MRTPPRSSATEEWYVVPGRRHRPRVYTVTPGGNVRVHNGGKAPEGGRGSSTDAAPTDKGNRRGREGSGEGVSRETSAAAVTSSAGR